MGLKRRRLLMRRQAGLSRLERREVPCGMEDRVPPLEIWLPENEHHGRPPGRYPCPGSNAVLVIYQPEEQGDA